MDLFVNQLNTTVKLLIFVSVFIAFYKLALRMLDSKPAGGKGKKKTPIERDNRKYSRNSRRD